jgi:hypothetical protein
MTGIATIHDFCPKDSSFGEIFPFGTAFVGQMIK